MVRRNWIFIQQINPQDIFGQIAIIMREITNKN